MKPPSSAPVRRQSNKPAIKATSKLNPQTGLVSSITSMFSADNWGATTRNYLKSIEKMKAGSLEAIVELAGPYMSPLKSRRGESSRSLFAGAAKDHDDVRACLEDDWHVLCDFGRVILANSCFFLDTSAFSLHAGRER
jgi:hypothetical protein